MRTPQRWELTGVGADDRQVTRLVGNVTVHDDQVARAIGTEIYPDSADDQRRLQ